MSTLEIKSNTANNHGIKIGMGRTQSQRPRTPLNKNIEVSNEEKLAVECGYWHLWHYNPEEDGQVLKAANTDGKEEMKVSNGIHLDSKEPDWSKLLTAFNFEIRCSQPRHRDLATPTLLHFGNAQASLALRSTSAAPIMGEVRYNSLMKTLSSMTLLHFGKASELVLRSTSAIFPQEAEVAKPANTYEIDINESEQLFVATERNAKLRYEGYTKFSEM